MILNDVPSLNVEIIGFFVEDVMKLASLYGIDVQGLIPDNVDGDCILKSILRCLKQAFFRKLPQNQQESMGGVSSQPN